MVLKLVMAATGATLAAAQSCSTTITPSYPAPSVAGGWEARIVARNLQSPRGILFDTNGQLLVVEQGKGITALSLEDGGGACISVRDSQEVLADESLSHGVELSEDGRTLYASSPETVSSWQYDPETRRTTSDAQRLITGMANRGHATRTLLLSRKAAGLLLVSWGSQSNVDADAEDVSSGVSQIRAFNISNATSAYDYKSDGLLVGWGLRNSVGVAEEPVTGGIYSVENSVDNLERDGQNIHQDNPGEEMNFHGFLNGTESDKAGRNFGYPDCFAAWDVEAIPRNDGLRVGSQFAIGDQTVNVNDNVCSGDRVAPRLTFQAHQAPLDIKFNSNGTVAWVTFHGSWNRDDPTGYKLSVVEFADGEPVEPSDSKTAAIDVMTNPDTSRCPDDCFRPVGLAWDRDGRLFMSSDSTGEIYVVVRADGSPVDDASPSGGLPSGTGAAPSPTGTGAGARLSLSHSVVVLLAPLLVLALAIF